MDNGWCWFSFAADQQHTSALIAAEIAAGHRPARPPLLSAAHRAPCHCTPDSVKGRDCFACFPIELSNGSRLCSLWMRGKKGGRARPRTMAPFEKRWHGGCLWES